MKELLKKAEEKMQKTADRLEHEYTTIRAGRANPAVLDKIMVDYYGVPTQINQKMCIRDRCKSYNGCLWYSRRFYGC